MARKAVQEKKAYSTPEERKFEVEEIVEKRMKEGKPVYLTKWKSLSHDYNTWEPRSNIHCDKIIDDFERKVEKSQPKKSSSEQGTKKKPWEKVLYFIFNPATGKVFKRSLKSWFQTAAYHIIFYAILAAIWVLLWNAFKYITIGQERPRSLGKNGGLIGDSPGLAFRPINLAHSNKIDIHKKKVKFQEDLYWQEWGRQTKEFLRRYKKSPMHAQFGVNDKDMFGNCTFDNTENTYMPEINKPCIYLKLNRIIGLENEPYNPTELPSEMPTKLQEKIMSQNDKNMIWVSCEALKSTDEKEWVKSPDAFTIYPDSHGFSNKIYSDTVNSTDFLSPYVAVQVTSLVQDEVIEIECRAWAKNIVYDEYERMGYIKFRVQSSD